MKWWPIFKLIGWIWLDNRRIVDMLLFETSQILVKKLKDCIIVILIGNPAGLRTDTHGSQNKSIGLCGPMKIKGRLAEGRWP